MRLIFATVLLVAALPVTAQIYQYTDAKGNRVFTDQPPLGVDASSIELRSTNSLPPPTSTKSTAPTEDEDNDAIEQVSPYSVLQLNGLPDEEALRANNGSFTVQVEITPKLASIHSLQLLVDGAAYGATSTSGSLQVENLERGEHRLAVQVLHGDKVLQSSAEQTITVQRVHTGSPALRPKPTPRSAP